jgi:hypothetical protein
MHDERIAGVGHKTLVRSRVRRGDSGFGRRCERGAELMGMPPADNARPALRTRAARRADRMNPLSRLPRQCRVSFCRALPERGCVFSPAAEDQDRAPPGLVHVALEVRFESRRTNTSESGRLVFINESWMFYQDHARMWHWKRMRENGARVRASTLGFETRAMCEQDAARNGWPGFEGGVLRPEDRARSDEASRDSASHPGAASQP